MDNPKHDIPQHLLDEGKRLTLTKMFEDMYNHIGDAELDTDVFNEELNAFLDRLLEDDYFGTEGQCDPRGDHRND